MYRKFMPSRASVFFVAALTCTSALSQAADLAPGSPAPALSVKKWYKGTPVKGFNANKTYVVEFWATWCGPCIETIPHLTELAKENKDVTFIGVSIWEDDKDNNIKNFIEKMGSKMDYHVGYSGNKTGMAKTWMNAASQNGIPTAFIVKNNKVMWIGHPAEMDQPLAQVKSGKFNLKTFKSKFEKEAAETKFAMMTETKIGKIRDLVKANNYPQAERLMAQFEKQHPADKGRLVGLKLQMMLKTGDVYTADERLAQWAASRDKKTTQTLIDLAMEQMGQGGDQNLGERIMVQLVEKAQKGDSIRFYFAAVYALQMGEKRRASDLIDRALEELPNSELSGNKGAQEAFENLKKEATNG